MKVPKFLIKRIKSNNRKSSFFKKALKLLKLNPIYIRRMFDEQILIKLRKIK